MAEAYKIAKIWGIDIELHWTLAALLLVAFVIGVYSDIFIFILITLLFVCVLIHELSHSFVALQNRVKVSRIILLPLGGASIIDVSSLSPDLEFNISIAGPLMSLLLGAVFGFLVLFAPPGALTEILQSLFLLNLLLGGFNLLPAFPTDGGRVFRSYLERKYDEYRATALTVTASKIVMLLFMVATVIYVLMITAPFAYKEFFFLWDLFIAFFLYSGAQQEMQTMEIKRESKGVKLRSLATKHFVLVSPSSSIGDLYQAVKRTREHLLITKLEGGYAYVNILRKERLKPNMWARDIAVMIPSVDMNENIVDALGSMESNESGIAAVTHKGKLVGVVTISHIQAFLSLHVLGKRKGK